MIDEWYIDNYDKISLSKHNSYLWMIDKFQIFNKDECPNPIQKYTQFLFLLLWMAVD